MYEIRAVVARNMKKYYRNVGMIIFSLLTAFIVAALYIFFLADMQIDNVKATIGEVEGIDLLIKSWLVGGFVFIPAISVPQMILNFKVDDIVEGKQKDLYVSPASRTKIMLGYVVSALIIGTIMTFGCFVVGEAYIVAGGGTMLSMSEIMRSLGIIFLVILIFTGVEMFIVSFVKTNSMVNVINSILNVFLGFLLGLYVPIGMLGESASRIIKSIPLIQAASILRRILMKESMDLIFVDVPEDMISEVRELYGVDIVIGETMLKTENIIATLIICGIIFYVGAAFVNRHRKEK
jgi:multidrug/hemolysin transport system permease protein